MNYPKFIKDIEEKRGFKVKVKGGDVGKPNCFNINLVILKKGLVNYFVENKDFLTTIKENQELIDYQIIKKSTTKTKFLQQEPFCDDPTSGVILPDKVLRMFPVTKGGKKILTSSFSNIPDVPERVVIIKENIMNMTINDIENFDINYYISAFNKLVHDWTKGVETNDDIDNIED